MRQSLRSHILYLENTIQDLRNRLTQPRLTPVQIEDLNLQLSLAESAVEHYRQAYTLELSVSGSQPPNQPAGTETEGATGRCEGVKSEKENDGLAVAAVHRAREWSARKRCAEIDSRRLRLPQQPVYQRQAALELGGA